MFVALFLQVPNLQWQAKRQCGGSILDRKPNVAREHVLRHIQILCDFFAEHLVYNDCLFNVNIECVTRYSFKSWRAYVHMILILFKRYMCAMFHTWTWLKNAQVLCTCSHTIKLSMHVMNIEGLEKAHHMNVSNILWEWSRKFFNLNFSSNQHEQIWRNTWEWMQIEGGWAYLFPWTICIIVGKIVLLFGKLIPSLIKMEINPSF